MSRPEHHIEMLSLFEQASEAAELFSRLADFAGNICSHIGIEDSDTVIAVVREKAQRTARRQLATLIATNLQPSVLEKLFPTDAPAVTDPIGDIFPGLVKKPRKRARSA